jgi:serine/threonine protein kinase
VTPERFASIRSCFEAVAGLSLDERARRLPKLTGDAEVIDEVLALCGAGAGNTRMSVSIGAALVSAVIRPPAPGDVLGIWRIEREIGQGGMGSVFLAERNDGHFRQRAAVKLLRGLPNAESLALFTRERQLLATLTHPSIGRLLDGGATPQGQPYLVMEYVEGSHIDEHCRREQLGVRAILVLFLTVCNAVASAHRQLVIHCDLKPSNLLVDGHGRPVLLDFGIARLAGRVEGESDGGERASPAFTPGYASPEQRSRGAVSTASDVYSLGVLLGELLEGAVDRRRASGLSLRELAAIVRCATREDPGERYATVDALMADIRRFLDRQPLQALHGVAGYGLRKELTRRWPVLVATAVFTLTVAAFTTKLVIESRRAQAAEQTALRERDRARVAETSSRQATDFLTSVFEGSNPNREVGEVPMSKLVAQAEARIEQELAGQPATRSDVYGALAQVQAHLGNSEKALAHYQHAIDIERRQNRPLVLARLLDNRAELLTALRGPQDAEADAREALALQERHGGAEADETVGARTQLGDLLSHIGRFREAEPLLLRSVQIRERIGPADSLANALLGLGNCYSFQAKHDQAIAALRRSLAVEATLVGESGEDYLDTLENLARALSRARRFKEAEAAFRRVLDRRRATGAEKSSIAWSLEELARMLADAGRPRESTPLYEEAMSIVAKVNGANSPAYGVMLNNLALTAEETGDLAAAERCFAQMLAVLEKQWGNSNLDLFRHNAGRFLTRIGKLDAARPLILAALDARISTLGAKDPTVGSTRVVLAEWYVKAGEAETAREQLDLARSSSPALEPKWQAASERQYALIHALAGRNEEALRGLESAERLDRRLWGDRDSRYLLGKLDRAELLARGTAKQRTAGAALAAEILKGVEPVLVPGSPLLARLRKLARQPSPIP